VGERVCLRCDWTDESRGWRTRQRGCGNTPSSFALQHRSKNSPRFERSSALSSSRERFSCSTPITEEWTLHRLIWRCDCWVRPRPQMPSGTGACSASLSRIGSLESYVPTTTATALVWVHRQRVDQVGPPVPAGVAVAQYLLRDLVAVVADQNGAEGDTNRFSLLGP
jgi:hypothetical protein